MQPKLLASLIDAMDEWLDANATEFVLTPKTADNMAAAAAVVFDAVQETAEVTEEYEAEEAG